MNSNRLKLPDGFWFSRVVEWIANSRGVAAVRRGVMGRVPFLKLRSDVTDVVYVTWLVDSELAKAYAPRGAVLWERDGLTPFTILTYRHGHFGPRMLGGLRRFLPSPLQSNWRLYLDEPLAGAPDEPTVVFVRNVFDSALHAVGTRVFSDALPSHVGDMKLSVVGAGARVAIEPRGGSAPLLFAEFDRADAFGDVTLFDGFASSRAELLRRLTLQDAAVVEVGDTGLIAFAEIALPVDQSSLVPLKLRAASLRCPLVESLQPVGDAMSFLLPSVPFDVLEERILPSGTSVR